LRGMRKGEAATGSRGRFLSMPRLDTQRVSDALWPPDLPDHVKVWVILDAAQDSRIFGAVDGSLLQKCCLYAGTLPWQLQMAAPYLVELERGERLTNFILANGWGKCWGVFLHASTTMTSLRRHLRGLLRVRDESGRKLIFRYYDPRVLRRYLPTCWTEELRTFFGPVRRFLMEDDDPETILEFGFDGVSLSAQSAGPAAAGRSRPTA
jgi:hypothetical protein